MYKFFPNTSFGQLLNISPNDFIFLETFDPELSYIEVWFIDQNSHPLEINQDIKYLKKAMDFCLLL